MPLSRLTWQGWCGGGGRLPGPLLRRRRALFDSGSWNGDGSAGSPLSGHVPIPTEVIVLQIWGLSLLKTHLDTPPPLLPLWAPPAGTGAT